MESSKIYCEHQQARVKKFLKRIFTLHWTLSVDQGREWSLQRPLCDSQEEKVKNSQIELSPCIGPHQWTKDRNGTFKDLLVSVNKQ